MMNYADSEVYKRLVAQGTNGGRVGARKTARKEKRGAASTARTREVETDARGGAAHPPIGHQQGGGLPGPMTNKGTPTFAGAKLGVVGEQQRNERVPKLTLISNPNHVVRAMPMGMRQTTQRRTSAVSLILIEGGKA